MKWVELRYYLYPLFIQQIERVEKEYIALIKDISIKKDKSKEAILNELRNSIEDRIDEIDEFIEDNFDKENVLHFEKGRLKLKKLIAIKPNQLGLDQPREVNTTRRLLEDIDNDEDDNTGNNNGNDDQEKGRGGGGIGNQQGEDCFIDNGSNIVNEIKKDQQLNVIKKRNAQRNDINANNDNRGATIDNNMSTHNKNSLFKKNESKGYERIHQNKPTPEHKIYRSSSNCNNNSNILSFKFIDNGNNNHKGVIGNAKHIKETNSKDNQTIKGKQPNLSRSMSNYEDNRDKGNQRPKQVFNDNSTVNYNSNCYDGYDKILVNNRSKPQLASNVNKKTNTNMNQSLPNTKSKPGYTNKKLLAEYEITSSYAQSNFEPKSNEPKLKEISLLFKLNEGEYRLLQKEKAKRVFILSS